MRKHVISAMILALIAAGGIWGQGVWTQVADFEGGYRGGAASFSIGDKGYVVCGGSSGSPGFHKDLWEYDPQSNSWAKKPDFPGGARANAVAFVIGDEAYVGMGYGGGFTFYSDFWRWNQTTDSWSQIADYPGEGGIGLSASVAFSIGGKGYVGTGGGWAVSPFRVSREFWEYDTGTNIWTQLPDLPDSARWFAVGFVVGGRGYVGTGEDINGDYHSDFWEYDPTANAWTASDAFSGSERYGATGFSIGSKGYVGAGSGALGENNDFWQWDQSAGLWKRVADYPGANGAGVKVTAEFVIGDVAYVGTGNNSVTNAQKDFWRFSPDSASGLASVHPETSFTLWPNPASTHVCVNTTSDSPAVLTLTTADGKVRLIRKLNSQRELINVSALPQGLYIVRMVCGNVARQAFLVKLSE